MAAPFGTDGNSVEKGDANDGKEEQKEEDTEVKNNLYSS